MPALWNSSTRLRTAPATSGDTSSQYLTPSAASTGRGRQARKTVLLAAALSRMCRLPPASVLMGHDDVIVNPASINPVASASQALVLWCVNITVMMPSGFSTR